MNLIFLKNRLLRRLLIALIFLAGYFAFQNIGGPWRSTAAKSIPIENVSEKMIMTFSKNPKQMNKNRLSIRVEGELSGMAVLHQIYDGEKKETYVLGPGKVKLKIEKDWEYPKCSLSYEPQAVASGHLGVSYRFD